MQNPIYEDNNELMDKDVNNHAKILKSVKSLTF
jgi:hypothetical protein